jgi:hypothetical protein
MTGRGKMASRPLKTMLFSSIFVLALGCLRTEDEKCEAKVVAATNVALRKEILSNDQVETMREPIKPREEYRYNLFENVESVEQ